MGYMKQQGPIRNKQVFFTNGKVISPQRFLPDLDFCKQMNGKHMQKIILTKWKLVMEMVLK